MVAGTQLGLRGNREQEQADQPAKSAVSNGCHVAVSEMPGLRPSWLLIGAQQVQSGTERTSHEQDRWWNGSSSP